MPPPSPTHARDRHMRSTPRRACSLSTSANHLRSRSTGPRPPTPLQQHAISARRRISRSTALHGRWTSDRAQPRRAARWTTTRETTLQARLPAVHNRPPPPHLRGPRHGQAQVDAVPSGRGTRRWLEAEDGSRSLRRSFGRATAGRGESTAGQPLMGGVGRATRWRCQAGPRGRPPRRSNGVPHMAWTTVRARRASDQHRRRT